MFLHQRVTQTLQLLHEVFKMYHASILTRNTHHFPRIFTFFNGLLLTCTLNRRKVTCLVLLVLPYPCEFEQCAHYAVFANLKQVLILQFKRYLDVDEKNQGTAYFFVIYSIYTSKCSVFHAEFRYQHEKLNFRNFENCPFIPHCTFQ